MGRREDQTRGPHKALTGGALVAMAVVVVLLPGLSSGAGMTTGPTPWTIYEQTTLPNGNLNFYPAGHGTMFVMPDATSTSPTYLNYVMRNQIASLAETNTFAATFTLTATLGSPSFLGDTFGGLNLATPAYVRLFFQSNLPATIPTTSNCVGPGHNDNNYWWADAASYTFPSAPSSLSGSLTVSLSAQLSPSAWSNICGGVGDANVAAFDSALGNITQVGLSFGSGYFFASGVGVDGSTGSVTFQLTSFTIS